MSTDNPTGAGAKFRAAVATEQPLQVVGAITAYAAKMAETVGFKAVYLSGGGDAADSLRVHGRGASRRPFPCL